MTSPPPPSKHICFSYWKNVCLNFILQIKLHPHLGRYITVGEMWIMKYNLIFHQNQLIRIKCNLWSSLASSFRKPKSWFKPTVIYIRYMYFLQKKWNYTCLCITSVYVLFRLKKKFMSNFSECVLQTTTVFIWTCQNVKVRTNPWSGHLLDNKKNLKQNIVQELWPSNILNNFFVCLYVGYLEHWFQQKQCFLF